MSSKTKKEAMTAAALKKREEGFDTKSIPHAKLTEYSALHDPNMRHYFENPKVQKLLYETGQIDKHGRVIDLNKNKAKLNILEREFKKAEEAEEQRLREEAEMRVSAPQSETCAQMLFGTKCLTYHTNCKCSTEFSEHVLMS